MALVFLVKKVGPIVNVEHFTGLENLQYLCFVVVLEQWIPSKHGIELFGIIIAKQILNFGLFFLQHFVNSSLDRTEKMLRTII